MTLPRRRFLHLAATAALPLLSRTAGAQAFPSRPVTIIVPYPAGGPADAVGRIMADGMRAALGQPVIIENVGGAVILPQPMLTPDRLVREVKELLADPARLKQMGEHARTLAVPDAAERIFAVLKEFCG